MNCSGKRIAFTGIAARYDRSTIHQAIRAAGGIVDGAVTAKTDLLVIGEDPGNGESKRAGAAKHGIPTMVAGDFMDIVQADIAGWPFPERPTKARKPKAAPKEVTQALRQLARKQNLPGFVGF